jgi:tetratricopeptide (TPR) repeat protein
MSRRKRSREKTSTPQPTKQNLASAGKSQWLERFQVHILPLTLLILAVMVAYANAWPNNLAWDDNIFAMGNRLNESGFAQIGHYFTDDAWAAIGGNTGIYRPLLLVSVALDIHFFGDWVAGFHLINILLQLLVTLVVYGFIRYLLITLGTKLPDAAYIALLAALVFAVHPVHTEVVNSIFNRSEMLVSLGIVGGLWWFLPAVEEHPWKAWGLLGLIYMLVMLSRETGIVLPGITVIFLWITTTGSWKLRLRKCVPVLWLLIPMAIFLGLRANALGFPLPFQDVLPDLLSPQASNELITSAPPKTARQQGLPVLGLYFGLEKILPAFKVWFDSIRLMLWPHPLLTYHGLSETNPWIALAAQLALFGWAVARLVQKKPGLFLGLTFFYLALLPSSRIVGERFIGPHLAERYLYMPSVGMTIVLAFGLAWLVQKFNIKTAAVPILAALVFMTPLTLARNAQWASTDRLAEADYRVNPESPKLLQTLVSTRLMKGDLAGASTLCDAHAEEFKQRWYLAGFCGQVFASLNNYDKAEQAFIHATKNKQGAAAAHYGLAVMYLRQNLRTEATGQFKLAVATEKQPFMQEYLSAEMLMRLYPSDPDRLLEARAHMDKCIELQPQFHHGRQRLAELNGMLQTAMQGRQ